MTSPTLRADLLVLGGGLGGVAACLTAARLGRSVILVERSEWLGGQLTTQGVPPDEHSWIETDLASRSYRELRDGIRDHYRRRYPLREQYRATEALNPGLGNVSRLCHEPRVGALVLEELISPYLASGLVTVLRSHTLRAVEREGRHITHVVVRGPAGNDVRLEGRLVADATEDGEPLVLAGLPLRIGAESRAETGELHAPADADPLNHQAVTWCCAVEYRPGEDHTIERPAEYDYWRTQVAPFWPGPQLSWTDVVPHTLQERTRPLFAKSPEQAVSEWADDLWQYRRILSREVLDGGFTGGEVTLVNWPQVDYWDLPLVVDDPDAKKQALQGARALTLSFVYWMQTEAPRHDGGTGYPELRLRGDVMGTVDGLAKEPYLRESRRIVPLFTVTEGHIGRAMRGDRAGSEVFPDSVGTGYYRIDLHPSTAGRSYVDIDCFPFQIPLGALIPQDTDNVVAGAKNIGTTHITNGAYRLHPVEWSIGEAVGALADSVVRTGETPEAIRERPDLLAALQQTLRGLGVNLAWPEEIRTGGAQFDRIRKPVEANDDSRVKEKR